MKFCKLLMIHWSGVIADASPWYGVKIRWVKSEKNRLKRRNRGGGKEKNP